MFFDTLIVRKVLTAMDALGGLAAWLRQPPEQVLTLLAREIGSEQICSNLASFDQLLEQQFVAIRAYIETSE